MKNIFYFYLAMILALPISACSRHQDVSPTLNASNGERFAQDTLMDFLESLHSGNYEEAAQLYGGSYETMIDQNPALDPNDQATLLRNACTVNGMQCLQVKSAVLDEVVSDTKFVFKVDFIQGDGTLFVLDPCCGGDEMSIPPQSVFYFKVIEGNQNEFTIMDMPPYVP